MLISRLMTPIHWHELVWGTGLIPVSDTPLPDDHFTMIHKTCCVGRSLLVKANKIIDSVDGIELEAVASKAPPPQPTQALALSIAVVSVGRRWMDVHSLI